MIPNQWQTTYILYKNVLYGLKLNKVNYVGILKKNNAQKLRTFVIAKKKCILHTLQSFQDSYL